MFPKTLAPTALLATALLAGCSESPSTPAAPTAEPGAQAAPAAQAAQAATPIPTPDITISTAPADIKRGEEVFAAKGCPACHKVGGGKLVGPDLKGVTARRDQEWVEKMVLRPDVMVKEDAVAKKLFAEHLVPMPNQGVDATKELPLILSYLKANE